MQRASAKKLADLRVYRHEKGLSQAELAKELGIDQSTVSRRERKPPQRHSEATYKLCSYAETKAIKAKPADRRAVQKSFDEVWSRSDAHANALSKIIDAFVELCRSDQQQEEDSG